MTRHHRTTSAALAVGLSLALVGTAAPAQAERGGARPDRGSEPLPGYTVQESDLEPITVDGEQTTLEKGIRNNAAYVIEKPATWNGELVMWAHGYRGTGTVLTVDAPGYDLRQRFLEQGYAWAASSYARNGYDVGTGVTTTQKLARYTKRVLGKKAKRTYVAGVSMGGHVIGRSLEQYPKFYDGALPMCGVMGDVELFDYFLSYNLAAQELADVDAYPFPADYYPRVSGDIQDKLGIAGPSAFAPSTPEGQQLRAVTADLSGGQRPGAAAGFGVYQDFLFTLGQADNGGPLSLNAGRVAQNRDTTYSPNEPVDLNAEIERVGPTDRRARTTKRLDAVPTIQGKPKVPVLTLHGLGDLFVPFSMEQIYARDVASNRQSKLLVQRAVRSVEHCDFTPIEAGEAWDDLTAWVESFDNRRSGTKAAKGKKGRRDAQRGRVIARPAGDVVLDPAVVAQRTYGCTYTDPTAAPTDAFENRAATRGLLTQFSGPCPAGSSAYGG